MTTKHIIAAATLTAALAAGVALAGTASPALAAPAFGPQGYGGVTLGMSAKAAQATGKIVHKSGLDSPSCSGWDLKAHRTGRDTVGLFISKKQGVAIIFAPKGVKTPQGIGIGSTNVQLKRAYATKLRTAASGFPYVAAPGNAKAHYYFLLRNGKIYEMGLALDKQDCAN
ncbi:hypothetical protein [Nonomuraea sp. NPDC001023]|uniref:hypothetical protein n=1 Tax=unclassified Nonomuraea TaxID=2593643 RepID=UPI003324479B